MTYEELTDYLLTLTDEERQQFLLQHQPDLNPQVVEAFKARADDLLVQDPRRSHQIASVALEVASLSNDPLARGAALWAQGNALFFLGDCQEGLVAYRQAQGIYEQANRRLEVARLLTNQVAVLRNLAEYDQALQTAALARPYLEPLGPTRYLAILEMNVGAVQRHKGDYDQALAAYGRGREIFTALNNPIQVARMDLNRANVLENLDRFTEAESLLEQARATLDEEGAALEVARADLNLGITAFRQGRYRTALRHFERAQDGFDALHLQGTIESATVDLYRSRTYLALNLLPEAIRLTQSARRDLAKQGLRRYVATSWSIEAQARQRQGDLLTAMRALDRARRVYRRIDDPVEVSLIDTERAGLLRETGEPRTGWRIAQRTARFLASHNLPVRRAQAQIIQAHCALDLGWLDRARRLAQDVLKAAQTLGLTDVAWSAYHTLGQIAEQEGRETKALQAYQSAIARLQHLVDALSVDEFRAGFLADKITVYEDSIRVALTLGQIEDAFALTQTAVAVMILGIPITPQDLSVLEKTDRRLRQRLEHLRRTWHWKRSALEANVLDDSPASEEIARSTEIFVPELKALEIEIADLWRRWQVRRHQSGHPSPHPLSPPEVQAQLASDEALVQYVVVDDQVGAFVVRRDRFEYLPDLAAVSDVIQLMEAWRFTLEMFRLYPTESLHPYMEAWCSDAQIHQERLYRLIFASLEPVLTGIERLRLVLYPAMPIIPFAALYDGDSYLVERFELAWLPAITMLHDKRHPSPEGCPVVVGCSDEGRLPYAVAEAERVAATLRRWSPVLLIKDAANEQELRWHLPTCHLLHLATHASFRSDNPFLSWIHLADAHLTVADLYDLTLPGRPLVVLSACETGLIGQRGGGLIGPSRALFAVGASALIVSLWKVDDAATADLMEAFYEAYIAGIPATVALQRAQRHLLAQHPHPFYWAPFAFVG